MKLSRKIDQTRRNIFYNFDITYQSIRSTILQCSKVLYFLRIFICLQFRVKPFLRLMSFSLHNMITYSNNWLRQDRCHSIIHV